MIRPLRQRHRVMMIALAVCLPTAFAIGIVTRKQVPTMSFRQQSVQQIHASQTELWTRTDLWDNRKIGTRLLKIGTDVGTDEARFGIELISVDHIIRPDVLVYWVPGDARRHDSLPDDAELLGHFEQTNPAALSLPAQAASQAGSVLLYSLADHEIVAISKPFKVP